MTNQFITQTTMTDYDHIIAHCDEADRLWKAATSGDWKLVGASVFALSGQGVV